MGSTVMGIKKFTAKSGKKMCMLFVAAPFATFDRSNAELIAGNKVETEWIEEEIAKKLDASVVGKNVTILKEISGNRAYITDIIIEK